MAQVSKMVLGPVLKGFFRMIRCVFKYAFIAFY